MRNKQFGWAVFFIAPSLTGFAIFFLAPFISVVYYSFIDSPFSNTFVGITNYMDMIKNPSFILAAKNSLIFTAISVPINVLLSLTIAVLLNNYCFFKKLLRSAFILPLVIPVASVVLFWEILFDYHGALNSILSSINIEPVHWLQSSYSKCVVVLLYLWKNIGYNIVLFLVGLNNIPKVYSEVYALEGASWRSIFRNVTLVYLSPTTFFVIIISIINSFKIFRESYLLTGRYPDDSLYMLQYYLNNVFAKLDYQKLSTAAILIFGFICVLILIFYGIEREVAKNTSI